MFKFIETQTKWGNHFKTRFYIDGTRVSKDVFDYKFQRAIDEKTMVMDKTETLSGLNNPDHRHTWIFE